MFSQYQIGALLISHASDILLIELLLSAVTGLAIFRSLKRPINKKTYHFIAALSCFSLAALFNLLSIFGIIQTHAYSISQVLLFCGLLLLSARWLTAPTASQTRYRYYHTLLASLNDACFIVSNQQILVWNEMLVKTLNSGDDLLGKDPWQLWRTRALSSYTYPELREKLRDKSRLDFKSIHRDDDGNEVILEITVSVLKREEEELLIRIHDATQEHASAQRIRENEVRLSRAQEIAGLAYWHIYSKEGVRQLSADGVKSIFGIDAENLSLKVVRELLHPSDADDAVRTMMNAIIKGQVPDSWKFRIIRSDGEMRHLRGQIGVLKDDAGQVSQVIGVLQDITETVRSEDRLRHAQKMEAVGELTGGLSHDFNNLLHVILGNVELIQGTQNPEDEESLNAIRRAAERGSELTKRLLAFSRKQILDPKSSNVNECVERMLPLLRRTLGEAIQIESNPSVDLFKCKVDTGQLENSILNLAINAQHSMPEGGILSISTDNTYLDKNYTAQQEEVSPGSYVQISIGDTGVGMPEQILDRVFEPFFTTKEVGKGSGLGLSMVYGFIKQSGGHVSIQSQMGKGTTVNLFLPISSPEFIEVSEQKPVNYTRFKGKIMLVEDDAEVATLTRKFLESVGLDVVPARHAKDALTLLKDHSDISLLLSDVVLPGGIHGPKLAQQILKQLPDLKVVFMSGYTEDTTMNQGITDKGISLLHKPFRKTDLIEKLQQAFAR